VGAESVSSLYPAGGSWDSKNGKYASLGPPDGLELGFTLNQYCSGCPTFPHTKHTERGLCRPSNPALEATGGGWNVASILPGSFLMYITTVALTELFRYLQITFLQITAL